MIALFFLIPIIWGAGMLKTVEYHVDQMRGTGGWFEECWAAMMSTFWPLYWAGKLLVGVTDRLQLPPGDGL